MSASVEFVAVDKLHDEVGETVDLGCESRVLRRDRWPVDLGFDARYAFL